MENLDEIDLKILRYLQEDSNITTKELSKMVHLSPTPVFERVKRLEKGGFIKKYAAILDSEKLNKDLIVYCSIVLKQHTREIGQRFVKDINALDEVTECYNISGDYDFLLKIHVTDMKDYQEFVINKLGSVENIASTHSTFVMGKVKQSYALPF